MNFHREEILRLKNGEEDAFKLLVNTFSKKLLAYAISLTGNHSLAKDIVQEVFISTYEYRKKIDPNYPIQSFLFKTNVYVSPIFNLISVTLFSSGDIVSFN